MSFVNVLEIAGSVTAVTALAGVGLVYMGAVCVEILREFRMK